MHTWRSTSAHPGPAPSTPGARDRRRRFRRASTLGALLGVAALLVSACSSGGSAKPAGHPAAGAALAALPRSTPAALAPYYDQKLTWRACGVPGFQCATL